MPRGDYRSLLLQLEPGDLVLAYSDGVTDARSPRGEHFGEERLKETVRGTSARDAQGVLTEVLAAVNAFSRGSQRYDDVTLLAIGRVGRGNAPGR
ncbi:MAG: serine/threonine-protein phosphatase, partial [Holophagales bacterium]|nr:serine/threonine-protein phosphatase [Holophagales bacterium]